jgi:hypothetical protein
MGGVLAHKENFEAFGKICETDGQDYFKKSLDGIETV